MRPKVFLAILVYAFAHSGCKKNGVQSNLQSMSADKNSGHQFIYPYIYSKDATQKLSVDGKSFKRAMCIYSAVLKEDSILMNDPIKRFQEARPITTYAIDYDSFRSKIKMKAGSIEADKRFRIATYFNVEEAKIERDTYNHRRETSKFSYDQARDNRELPPSYLNFIISEAVPFAHTNLFKCPIFHPNAY